MVMASFCALDPSLINHLALFVDDHTVFIAIGALNSATAAVWLAERLQCLHMLDHLCQVYEHAMREADEAVLADIESEALLLRQWMEEPTLLLYEFGRPLSAP